MQSDIDVFYRHGDKAETKLDKSLSNKRFILKGYHFRLDITDKDVAWCYLLNHTYNQKGLLILKFRLTYI